MSDAPPGENGARPGTPRLPTGLVAASVAIALLAVSGLIFLLYRETKGPGEILRQFATAVDKRDCSGSYDLLDEEVRASFDEDDWCSNVLPSVDDSLDADFTVERAILEGDTANVQVSGVELTEWRLRRYGERSWRVVGPEPGFPITSEAQMSTP